VPLLRSFGYAFAGLAQLIRTQRNFRIELGLGGIAVVAGAWARLTSVEWAVLALTIALVLILEAVNTAIEHTVTLASPALDPRAKSAKDVSAAAVLLAAVASLVVGVALLWPRLTAVLGY
jgi:diacylglycerol kinase